MAKRQLYIRNRFPWSLLACGWHTHFALASERIRVDWRQLCQRIARYCMCLCLVRIAPNRAWILPETISLAPMPCVQFRMMLWSTSSCYRMKMWLVFRKLCATCIPVSPKLFRLRKPNSRFTWRIYPLWITWVRIYGNGFPTLNAGSSTNPITTTTALTEYYWWTPVLDYYAIDWNAIGLAATFRPIYLLTIMLRIGLLCPREYCWQLFQWKMFVNSICCNESFRYQLLYQCKCLSIVLVHCMRQRKFSNSNKFENNFFSIEIIQKSSILFYTEF